MIRTILKSITPGIAEPQLAGYINLDDDNQLILSPEDGFDFDWIPDEVGLTLAEGNRVTAQSDLVRWVRLLPAMLRNYTLYAATTEDTHPGEPIIWNQPTAETPTNTAEERQLSADEFRERFERMNTPEARRHHLYGSTDAEEA
ncbi:MAG: hypothetical protein ACTII7_09780 [Galactobacter sp.]